MLRRVVLVRANISEERITIIIRVTRIGEQGTTLALFLRSLLRLLVTANIVPSAKILVNLMMDVIRSLETSVLTRVIRRNISEDGIFQQI
jgi:ABC-type phosphate/phosphonate transport system permease subunit